MRRADEKSHKAPKMAALLAFPQQID